MAPSSMIRHPTGSSCLGLSRLSAPLLHPGVCRLCLSFSSHTAAGNLSQGSRLRQSEVSPNFFCLSGIAVQCCLMCPENRYFMCVCEPYTCTYAYTYVHFCLVVFYSFFLSETSNPQSNLLCSFLAEVWVLI